MDELLPEIEELHAHSRPRTQLCSRLPRRTNQPLPKDDRARALSKQVFLLSEFLELHAKDFRLPEAAQRMPSSTAIAITRRS